jgi:phosphoribosylformylglycinamidine cyclo-ligase
VAERLRLGPHDRFPEHDESVADVLLAVHRSYLAAFRPVLGHIHAMAHITGGGIPGNLDRALPDTLDAVVEQGSWEIPAVFRVLEQAGGVAREEMLRAFNMGVGMIAIVGRSDAAAVLASAAASGIEGWIAGEVVAGSGAVVMR